MDDDKDEPFRNSLNFNNKNNLIWKKIGIIFIVLSIILIVIIIIISIIGFKSNEESDNKESDNKESDNEESDNSNKNEENIWNWSPAGDKIKTKWGKNIDPKTVWQEYPRPQLERKDWINLNGLWKYAVKKNNYLYPDSYDGYILVPFALESSLSGVMKDLKTDEVIFYETDVTIPDEWNGKNLLLNF